jgi:PhzF family phenazine biosynthesis protein
VCVLPEPRDERWMQQVAAEMNLAETAFLVPRPNGDDGPSFDLRWFTPSLEVALCGHATLASAHALWHETRTLPPGETARFHTMSGLLTATRDGDWIELNFPATPAEPADAPPALLEALGVATPPFVGRSRFDYLVELEHEDAVRALAPDLTRLRSLPVRGVIATSASSTRDRDFVSRFFAPAAGVDEDPVTGSAHCCLMPYWSAKLARTELVGEQISARGGVVKLRLDGDRVRMSGQAVTVLRGQLDA